MIKDGALQDPKVDAMVSFHLWNPLPTGTIGLRPGPLWASVDELRIIIKGKGGHGAAPHNNIDPIPAAAQVVLALQMLISRESSPFQPAVLTIGSFHGGSAWNVTPEQVVMAGTMRTFDTAQRDTMIERVEDIVRGVCLANRTDYEFEAIFSAPPVVNDPSITETIRSVAERIFGPERVTTADQAMFGDDISYFFNEVPGCYIMVGSSDPKRGLDKSHHHPQFDFDEAALPIGAELLIASALELLSGP